MNELLDPKTHLTGGIASDSAFDRVPMNSEARDIFNTLQALLPTRAAKKAFKSAVHHPLKADGNPRPQHCKTTSPSTISRFHNKTRWDTQALIRAMQAIVINIIIKAYKHTRGEGQIIKARLDLTTLEKTGNFPNLPITGSGLI